MTGHVPPGSLSFLLYSNSFYLIYSFLQFFFTFLYSLFLSVSHDQSQNRERRFLLTMDSNWRPSGGDPTAAGGGPAAEPIANPDWRTQLQPEARHRIVTKIMETLKRHLPVPVPEGLNELQKIAVRFEEKIYSAATSQPDYLRKISLKMLSMETKTQGPQINPASNPNLQNPNIQNLQNPNRIDPGLGAMQASSNPNSAQSLSMPQTSRQMPIPQTFQSNSANQSMPTVTQQPPAGSMTSLSQPPAGSMNSLQSDMYAQRRQQSQIPQNQTQGNQIPQNQTQQNQNQNQNQNQMVYQQLMRQRLLQQQMSSGLTGQSGMTAGAGGMTAGMQVQQNQLNPQQQQQNLLRHQQQQNTDLQQMQMQQNQMRQNQMQQNQMLNMNNNNNMSSNNMMVGAAGNNSNNMNNMQQRRMMSQQMQPQQNAQSQNQQHLLSQFQNQQPGGNNNINNNIINNNNINNNNINNNNINNSNMMQLQQHQRSAAAMLQTQNGINNNINNNNNNSNNNNNNANNVTEQQKQFMQQQQQRVIQDVASSPASMDSTAQTGPNELAVEEVYQKLKTMKETYFNDLREIYQRLSMKLNQIDPALMGEPKVAEQIEKMKNFKNALERFLNILQLNKSTLQLQVNMKEKLNMYEKQIMNILASHKKTPQQSQQAPAQQSQIPPAQQQLLPAQQPDLPAQQFVPSQQIENNQMQQGNNFNMQNDQIQPNNNFNTMNGMNPPQTVGTGSGTGTIMSSHNNMMSQQQQQQNLNFKQQQEATVQQRIIQQNQIKQRHMQQILQKQLLQQQQQQQHLPLQQQIQQQQKQQQNINTNNSQPSQIPGQLNTDSSSLTDIKPRLKPGTNNPYQQPLYPGTMNSRTSYFHPQLKPGTSSPQIQSSLSPSPQVDQVKLERAHLHTNSPQNVPSPLIPDETKPVSNLHTNNSSPLVQTGQTGQVPSQSVQSIAVGTPGISASPLLAEFTSPETHGNNISTQVNVKSTVAETPIERLAKALRAASNSSLHSSLRSAITDIGSVVSMVDRVAGSAPGNGSRAAIGDDLVAMTKCRMQAKHLPAPPDGHSGQGPVGKKMKRDTSAMPLNNDNNNNEEANGSGMEGANGSGVVDGVEVESDATSSTVRAHKNEMNHGLMEEIKEINSRLIDTELTLTESSTASSASTTASSASSEGTVIKCIYTAVAISPGLRSHFASSQLSPILPLRLLVPSSYPKCSPIILDKLPEEQSRDFDDLSTKARSRLSASLRSLSQPLDLKEIAKTWDDCARNVILEYAMRIGGGSFSSGFGTWQNCVGA
ncbi:hypothetical protein LUZ60_012214 [Juncus effusus]|nr:hypothetical protein LUZ60_012214 [Juncus effusus]